MDDNAALERALEIYTSEYPRLNAMLEGLRAWIILKVFMTLHTHFLDREAQERSIAFCFSLFLAAFSFQTEDDDGTHNTPGAEVRTDIYCTHAE
jgi:hypothetical protein